MSPSEPKYLTGDKEGIKAFLDKFDVILFDCDGVLWSGEHLFPDTVQTLTYLRTTLQKRLIFVTNNSTKSRADYCAKLHAMGIPASADEIFGSAYSAAIYIARILQLPAHRRKVFVIGESGIEAELDSEGVPHLGGTDRAYRRDMTPDDYRRIASRDPTLLDPEVGAVLVGLDFHLNYLKLALAYHYIIGDRSNNSNGKDDGAVFLATNTDVTFPSSGALFPGAGTMSAPLMQMLGPDRDPPLALGKPSPAMMDAIEGRFRLDRARTCMVGDRLDTDIRFGVEGGLGGTLAVLTGVSRRDDIVGASAGAGAAGGVRPAAYVDKLGDLLLGGEG